VKFLIAGVVFLSAAAFATQPISPEAGDALDALHALDSATEVGVNLRDYSTRVIDAKLKVDRYLRDAPAGDKLADSVRLIMKAHVTASKAWAANLPGGDPGASLQSADDAAKRL